MNHRLITTEQESLSDALARLGRELAAHEPPLAVHGSVRARLAPTTAVPTLAPRASAGALSLHNWAPWATAALCGALLLVSAVLLRGPAATGGAQTQWVGSATGFVPVASAERWPTHGAPGRSAPAWLVRAELPRERLAELGLPFDPSRAADTVKAELLMQANGEVLAVRVLAETPQR